MAVRPTAKSNRPGIPAGAAAGVGSGEAAAAGPRRRGRRPAHTEHWSKVTVVLFDRQIVFLDRLSGDIRSASGAAISRAHLIRALVDALSESDLDLTGTRSEAELRAILTARLGRYRV